MRWIWRGLGVLLLLVVLAVGALFLIPVDRIAALATDRFEAATGRAMTLSGSLRPSLYPDLGISIGGVQIANADWSDQGPMLSAEKLSVAVDLGALISGDIRIKGFTINAAEVILERSADGHANWDFGSETGNDSVDSASSGRPISLDLASIQNAQVTYIDHRSDQRIDFAGLALTASLPSGQPADITLSGRMNGADLSVTASVAAPGALMTGGSSETEITAHLGKTQVRFAGQLMAQGDTMFQGRLSAEIADTAALIAALAIDPPEIPAGLGRSVTASGDATGNTDTMHLTGADLTLDQNAFAGDLALSLTGDKPHVTADLTTGAFDLTSLTDDDGDADAAPGWSTDPIDLGALDTIDGDFALTAASVDLGTAQIGRSRITATLRNGILTADIREMAAYGGALAGQVAFSGRNGVSMNGDITASGVALQAFMAHFLGFDRITGAGDLAVAFDGSGGSVDALMNSLSGKGQIAFGQGELLGIDLVAMLRNLDGSFGRGGGSTIFNSITASFDINDGVVNNVDLNFLAPLADALGDGTIGLGKRTMNYRVTPKLLRGEAGEAGISVPIMISGPWDNLSFRPDISGLLDAKAKEAVKQVEEAAKAKVQESLGGAEADVKQKLEDQVKKGLGGLLGGN